MKKSRNMIDDEENEDETDDDEPTPVPNSTDVPNYVPPKKDTTQVQVVEREISLSLINEKLNYIISLISKQ